MRPTLVLNPRDDPAFETEASGLLDVVSTPSDLQRRLRATYPDATMRARVVLVLATIPYLADSRAAFLLPNLELQIKPFLIVAPLVGEIWMVPYQFVKGVKCGQQPVRAPVADLAPIGA